MAASARVFRNAASRVAAILIVMLFLILACSLVPAHALADDWEAADVNGGAAPAATHTWGTCGLTFDATTGTLTIGAGQGASAAPGSRQCPQAWRDAANGEPIKVVDFNGDVTLPDDASLGGLFAIPTLERISGINNLGKNAGGVTNMSYMFFGCSSLEWLDLYDFTAENVTDMRSMFSGCSSLAQLDIEWMKVGSHVDTSNMFSGVSSIEFIITPESDDGGNVLRAIPDALVGGDAVWYGGVSGTVLSRIGQKPDSVEAGYAYEADVPAVITYAVNDANGGSTSPGMETIIGPRRDHPVAKGSTAKPNPGWCFVNWTNKDNYPVSTDATFVPNPMGGDGIYIDAAYTANFKELDHITITYKASEGGTVTPEEESVNPEGDAQGSKAKANDGYHFVKWVDADGKTVSTDAAFVPAKTDGAYVAATYTAKFEKGDAPKPVPAPDPKSSNGGDKLAQTGDSALLGAFSLIVLAAGGVLAMAIIRRRRA